MRGGDCERILQRQCCGAVRVNYTIAILRAFLRSHLHFTPSYFSAVAHASSMFVW